MSPISAVVPYQLKLASPTDFHWKTIPMTIDFTQHPISRVPCTESQAKVKFWMSLRRQEVCSFLDWEGEDIEEKENSQMFQYLTMSEENGIEHGTNIYDSHEIYCYTLKTNNMRKMELLYRTLRI